MPGDFSTAFMHTPLLESDEYWIEPPREVVPDTRIVWKLKKALNGSGNGQQEVPAAFVSTST